MRLPLAAAFLLAYVAGASAVNDGMWCYRDFGGPQYTNCSLYDARQCLMVAGTMGGICERDHKPAELHPKAKGKSRFMAKAEG